MLAVKVLCRWMSALSPRANARVREPPHCRTGEGGGTDLGLDLLARSEVGPAALAAEHFSAGDGGRHGEVLAVLEAHRLDSARGGCGAGEISSGWRAAVNQRSGRGLQGLETSAQL